MIVFLGYTIYERLALYKYNKIEGPNYSLIDLFLDQV